MADKPKPSVPEEPQRDRNNGKGVPNYDESKPNPQDIHSDDPLVAGLANGERQARGEGNTGGPVK